MIEAAVDSIVSVITTLPTELDNGTVIFITDPRYRFPMAICPECGSTIDKSQEFCRQCGEEIDQANAGMSGDDKGVQLKLKDKQSPIKVSRIRYHQGGGEWVTATLKDSTVRIYPRERVEYIQGGSVGVMGQGIRPVASKHEVKDVNTFSKASRILGTLTGN